MAWFPIKKHGNAAHLETGKMSEQSLLKKLNSKLRSDGIIISKATKRWAEFIGNDIAP